MTDPLPHRTADDPLLDELLDAALEAARRAGALLRDGRPADLGVAATKSSPIDVVTEMDIAAEKLITGYLAERRPQDGLLGEEGGATEGTSGIRWVVDPLDGTVNYLYGLPTWAVSIAAERDGEALVGVVEVPMRGETFHAVRGRGAHLGERRLSCRPAPPLDQALVSTGFNYVAEVRAHQAEVAGRLVPLLRDIRRGGSAAVDLADVAAGRLDGYYERGLRPWDRAAGVLLAREAGALTGGRPGSPADDDLTVAASPGAFAPLQTLLEDLGAWHD
ncbi:inositol monophosphatase family protein [Streptomyces kanasensis]|uniref:inositol monophosphatase family protein n=1 Tax=Streptomyces kanasensis TaxID=936756 RepID=UPI00382C9D84